jgi:hypothetical protein
MRAHLPARLLLAGLQPDREHAFSKIKAIVRRAEARTREALVEALGAAISEVSTRDARDFFKHCGYSMSVQPL